MHLWVTAPRVSTPCVPSPEPPGAPPRQGAVFWQSPRKISPPAACLQPRKRKSGRFQLRSRVCAPPSPIESVTGAAVTPQEWGRCSGWERGQKTKQASRAQLLGTGSHRFMLGVLPARPAEPCSTQPTSALRQRPQSTLQPQIHTPTTTPRARKVQHGPGSGAAHIWVPSFPQYFPFSTCHLATCRGAGPNPDARRAPCGHLGHKKPICTARLWPKLQISGARL